MEKDTKVTVRYKGDYPVSFQFADGAVAVEPGDTFQMEREEAEQREDVAIVGTRAKSSAHSDDKE